MSLLLSLPLYLLAFLPTTYNTRCLPNFSIHRPAWDFIHQRTSAFLHLDRCGLAVFFSFFFFFLNFFLAGGRELPFPSRPPLFPLISPSSHSFSTPHQKFASKTRLSVFQPRPKSHVQQ